MSFEILFLAKKKLNFRDMVDENDIKTDINFADLQNFLMSRWIADLCQLELLLNDK